MPMTLRGAIMGLFPTAAEFMTRTQKHGPYRTACDLGFLCRYAQTNWSTKKRVRMDIPRMVKLWVDTLAEMSHAHTKDQYDAADFKSDDLFGPILTAPVAQIREFYGKLIEAMNEDKRIPWIVRAGFEAWGEVVIKNAKDDGVKRLKNKLASEIAELCEGPVAEQLPEAIKRALRWRDPEQLEQVKEQLQAGHKPKLKGRESCLFLEVGRGKKKTSVML
jgi:hypothetical protein